MPRIRMPDCPLDICLDCWNDISDADIENLAKLAYCHPKDIKEILTQEESGGYHPPYGDVDKLQINQSYTCVLCDSILTNEDNEGESYTGDEDR